MSLPYQGKLIPRAKELRKSATRQENHLWYDFLRTYPVRFQRQKTIDHFIVDFYCASAKLIIELDGSQHYSEQGLAYDLERSAVSSKYGVTVLPLQALDLANKKRPVTSLPLVFPIIIVFYLFTFNSLLILVVEISGVRGR